MDHNDSPTRGLRNNTVRQYPGDRNLDFKPLCVNHYTGYFRGWIEVTYRKHPIILYSNKANGEFEV